MSLRLVRAVAETENLDDFHLSRLLVLVRGADARKNTPTTRAKAIEGITKLAKLDFLLRYPTCLERALRAFGNRSEEARVLPRERVCVETRMIRFRYGPWDGRYRRWLGLLDARGLVTLGINGNTVQIGLTDRGRSVADEFRSDPLFADIAHRSEVIAKTVGTMTASRLKQFVYDVVPEIVDMKWGEEVDL